MQVVDNTFTVQAKQDIVLGFVYAEFGYYKGSRYKLVFCKKNPLPGVFKHSNTTDIDNNTFIMYCNTEFRRNIDNNHYYLVICIPKGTVMQCNITRYGEVEAKFSNYVYTYSTSRDRFRYESNADYELVRVIKQTSHVLLTDKLAVLLSKLNNKTLFQEILEI